MIHLIPVRTITRPVTTAVDMTTFGFSTEELNGVDAAQMTAYTANIRYSVVGPPVITSAGHLVEANKDRWVTGKEAIGAMTVIAESGSPVLTITLWKATEGAI